MFAQGGGTSSISSTSSTSSSFTSSSSTSSSSTSSTSSSSTSSSNSSSTSSTSSSSTSSTSSNSTSSTSSSSTSSTSSSSTSSSSTSSTSKSKASSTSNSNTSSTSTPSSSNPDPPNNPVAKLLRREDLMSTRLLLLSNARTLSRSTHNSTSTRTRSTPSRPQRQAAEAAKTSEAENQKGSLRAGSGVWPPCKQNGRTPKTPVLVDAYPTLNFDDEEAQVCQEEEYRHKVGSLQIAATTTRPDIAFACSKLGSGLTSLKLVGYVDAADASDKQNRTSTGGYVFVFGVATVSWLSQRIKCATLLSTESEYVAATEAGKEGRRLHFLLAEFRQLDDGTPTVLRVDNKSAITVAEGMGLTGNLKHMERRQAWLQHMVKRGKFSLRYILAAEQPADFLTKALHYPAFNWCSVAIGQALQAAGGVAAAGQRAVPGRAADVFEREDDWEEGEVEEREEEDGVEAMEEEGEGSGGKGGKGGKGRGGPLPEFKEKVLDVLKAEGYEDKRSSKLSEDDFVHLLAIFNRAGIHFG
ncbi:unnamed protein product [Closterium sp. NIES-54]